MKFIHRHATGRTLIASAAVAALMVGVAPPALADQARDSQWHLKYLNIDAAHQITRGKGVTVAVIDSGVKGDHPDLVGNVLPGLDDAIKPASPANGWVDMDGHGTKMAGLIAGHGRGHGSDGVLGIAPEAKILPIRTKNTEADMVQTSQKAFEFAMNNGAKVINMSFGMEQAQPAMEFMMYKAFDADISIVASVGNLPDSTEVEFPASHPGVIGVAGIDRNGNHSKISTTGPLVVLSAPSDDIVGTDPNGRTRSGTGTSNATAIVSGAVALLRAKFPDLPQREIANRLIATAVDKGKPGRDEEYGYGVIDINAALTADIPLKDPAAAAKKSAGPVAARSADSDADAGSSSTGLMVAVGVGGAILVLGLVGLLVARSRRRSAPPGGPHPGHPEPGPFPGQPTGPYPGQQYPGQQPAGQQYANGPQQYPPGPHQPPYPGQPSPGQQPPPQHGPPPGQHG